MERLRSQLALAAFLQELGEAVEEAEVVNIFSSWEQLDASGICILINLCKQYRTPRRRI